MTTMAATAHRSTPAAPRPGLRERKKIKTRTAIREATYRLVREQGYEATTIEQIAEAAEVSTSTVFRYFPAKEDIVLTGAYAPVLEEELRARPAGEPLAESLRRVAPAAVERSMRGEFGTAEDTVLLRRLMVEVPAVRSRMNERMAVTGRMLCRVAAERTGRDPDGLEVRVHCMGVAAALTEAFLYWAEHGRQDDLGGCVTRALDVLERGLTPEEFEAP
jgi:AcrR family transcriptional regulator